MDLRPSSLDDLGLAATITWFCRQFQLIYSGIRIEKRVLVDTKIMPENLKTTIFRILQETFNNVAKHSGADLIRLDLIQDETSVTLTIEDNGTGFEIETQNKNALDHGFGLPGLQERAELAGGIFSIFSKKEKGTTVQVVWSYQAMSPFPRA
jgi:signal transduction histidine kinase